MQFLVALQQAGGFSHDGMQVGNHAKAFLRFFQQRLAGFGGRLFSVQGEIGHGVLLWISRDRRCLYLSDRSKTVTVGL